MVFNSYIIHILYKIFVLQQSLFILLLAISGSVIYSLIRKYFLQGVPVCRIPFLFREKTFLTLKGCAGAAGLYTNIVCE